MKNNIKYFTFFFLIFCSILLNAEQPKKAVSNNAVDSLITILKKSKEDTAKVNTQNTLSRLYIAISCYEQAIQCSESARLQSEKLNFKKGEGDANNLIAIGYWFQGNYEKSLTNYLKALKLREEIGDKKGIVNSYRNIAIIYENQGNNAKALDNHNKALKIMEEIGDKPGIALSYRDIGYVYMVEGKYAEANINNLKSLNIMEEAGDKNGIADSYVNIGNVYLAQDNYEKALFNLLKALKIKEQFSKKEELPNFYDNITDIYMKQGDAAASKKFSPYFYRNALDYQMKSLKIKEQKSDSRGMAYSYNTIGTIYMKQNKFDEAGLYLNKALYLFNEIKSKDGMKDTYSSLTDLSETKGDYAQACMYYKLYSDLKDTMLNEHSSKQLSDMSSKYESEKKERDIDLLTKDKTLQEAEVNKQKLIRNTFIGGLALAVLLAFLLINRFSTRQKLNTVLSAANNELTQKNVLIEKQKEKIIASINYAQLIQQSILMEESEIQKHLPDSFVYFQPKDIVSGDFYWFSKIDDKIIIAAIDCTGHGVPGAFMSMIGNTLLNQIVNEKHICKPSEILRHLNLGVYEALHQQKDGALSEDGMDTALCCIDYKNNELQYAGQNPLYILRGSEIEIIKGDIRGIGGGGLIAKIHDPLTREFTNHIIPIQKGTSIYLSTDGYLDQFGGGERKKFGTQKLKETLLNNQHLNMQQQKELIASAHNNWKGNVQQIDDILVIGIRF